jgi:alanyl-tRNA synthetase
MKTCAEYGKANNKSIYVFSVDRTAGKVAYVNFVPQELVKSKKLDAKVWLEEANKVLGGKVSINSSPSHDMEVQG